MPGIVIFKMNLWPIVQQRCSPKMLTIDRINVEVTFPADPELQAVFRKDPLLYQKLQDKIKTYMTEHVVNNLGNVVRTLDPKAEAAAKIDDVQELLRILDKFQETANGYAKAAATGQRRLEKQCDEKAPFRDSRSSTPGRATTGLRTGT
jgi:hypothetical protein